MQIERGEKVTVFVDGGSDNLLSLEGTLDLTYDGSGPITIKRASRVRVIPAERIVYVEIEQARQEPTS